MKFLHKILEQKSRKRNTAFYNYLTKHEPMRVANTLQHSLFLLFALIAHLSDSDTVNLLKMKIKLKEYTGVDPTGATET